MESKKIIGIIGDSTLQDEKEKELAFNLGKTLVDHNYRVMSGGLGGIMDVVLDGARSSSNYNEGDTIAVLPSFDKTDAEGCADIVITTGMDLSRGSVLTGSADAVIVVGGKAGTLAELSTSWSLFKLVISMSEIEGVSKDWASKRVDSRIRYEQIPEDCVYPAKTPEDAIALLDKYLPLYNKYHHGIRRRETK